MLYKITVQVANSVKGRRRTTPTTFSVFRLLQSIIIQFNGENVYFFRCSIRKSKN